MCCKNLLLKIAVLGITFGLGSVAAAFFFEPSGAIGVSPSPSRKSAATAVSGPNDRGTGISGSDYGGGVASDSPHSANSATTTIISGALTITSKPRPTYTDAARNNDTQGSVRLKITFLANGQIGGITVVNGLPDGLTEQAIAAAKQIKFEPKKVNGVPVSVVRVVEYSFTIY